MAWTILVMVVLSVASSIAIGRWQSRSAAAFHEPFLRSTLEAAGLRVVSSSAVPPTRTPFPRVTMSVGEPRVKVLGVGAGDAYPVYFSFSVVNQRGLDQACFARVRADDLGKQSIDWLPHLAQITAATQPIPIPRAPGFRIEPPPGTNW